MTIEDLGKISVTSVSKTEQPLSDAPAAIYVISHEDVIRSGAVTLPEMLRLAPNLQVYQQNPGEWVITARGLNGNAAAQNFPNKLLVLIDGRPVYTPLFSGVYWDLPDVLPDNVDRIEVISGPGATLFGANAVNGVINVITRSAGELGGVYADARLGPDRSAIGLRFGGRIGESIDYSVFGRLLRDDGFVNAAGADAQDGRRRVGGGFRLDWTPTEMNSVTLNGEVFDTRLNQPGGMREDSSGINITGLWRRSFSDDRKLQVQGFFDRISRDDRAGGGVVFNTRTFDGEVQYNYPVGQRHSIVMGAGARLFSYDITGTPSLFFDPPRGDLFIANAFVQDTFALTPNLTLTGGLKVEKLPYAGASILPEFRIAWKVSPSTLIWASAARAVRSPTPFDVDVEERVGNLVSVSGDPQFRTEKLTSAELGTRLQPSGWLSMSATVFYHRYDDLRSIEFAPGPAAIALGWGNGLRGELYGAEVWADLSVASWWTLSGGATILEHDFEFQPGSSGLFGLAQLGTDPPYVVKLHSAMSPVSDLTIDFNVRAYGALRGAAAPAYRELGGRIAWQVLPGLLLSVSGTNLLHEGHLEYPGSDRIPRRIVAGAEIRF
jgi:iron complex outermembrane receptor protein